MRRRRVLPLALCCALLAPAQEPTRRFENRNGTFHVTVPAHWRQLSPGEARQIGDNPRAPEPLRLAQPQQFYAVGPVDEWLAGDFHAPWLYVREDDNEWYLSDSFADDLRTQWQRYGEAKGERHQLADVRRTKVGEQQIEVVTAIRTATWTNTRPPLQSLDVYAPAVGKQVTLSFCCAPADFATNEPAFRRWLGTLTFARVPRGQTSLGDRLWTPILTGLVVGAVLLVLYRYTRARR